MRYAVGVGSNRGDRSTLINEAAALINDGMSLVAFSPLLETAPVGGPCGQGAFLNAAWLIDTPLGPHQVLHRLQVIESTMGRTRSVHWGSRTLDLDLLLREDGLVVSTPVLTLPHPLLYRRAFVLTPLAAIAGSWVHPLLRKTVDELAHGAVLALAVEA